MNSTTVYEVHQWSDERKRWELLQGDITDSGDAEEMMRASADKSGDWTRVVALTTTITRTVHAKALNLGTADEEVVTNVRKRAMSL